MSTPKSLEPASDAEYARQAADAVEAYLIAMDVAIGANYPNADGEGVRSFEPYVWELLGSVAQFPKGQDRRVPTISEVERLAAMADRRQAVARMSEADLFAPFAGSDR
ncbi:MAG TPA: hypothetical protein VGW74_08075 [Propionibacteriaceae bacterium]|nr:hypothetical protein [Propionibacteriaceae bacterium]